MLRRDVEGSIQGRALFTSGIMWSLFGQQGATVRTGQPLPAGREGFKRLADDPGLDGMHRAMVESSRRVIGDAVNVHDFSRYTSVLDIGGGYGGALGALLDRFTHLTGSVFDLPYLKRPAHAHLNSVGAEGRATFICGDFFEFIPPGFDCLLLKYIIHDWGDTEAQQILRKCAHAAGRRGNLLILERVLPEVLDETPECRALMQIDLAMMTTGGKERTEVEYRELLRSAGFRVESLSPMSTPCSIIHAVVQ